MSADGIEYATRHVWGTLLLPSAMKDLIPEIGTVYEKDGHGSG
jgi:hypothetical protein